MIICILLTVGFGPVTGILLGTLTFDKGLELSSIGLLLLTAVLTHETFLHLAVNASNQGKVRA